MSDWDASDDETTKVTTAPAVVPKPPNKKANKWEGEDEEDNGPVVSLLPRATLASYSHLHSLDLWIR